MMTAGVNAEVWLEDGVPVGAGGYAEGSINDKNVTIKGESGKWTGGTAVFQVRGAAYGLDYSTVPSSLQALEGSGTYAVNNSSTGTSESRFEARALSLVPAATNVYFSLLTRYEAGALTGFKTAGVWTGVGLTVGGSTDKAVPIYTDGFVVGYQTLNINGVLRPRLVGHAGGTETAGSPIILHDDPQPGVTYMVAVKVEYNGDGPETVSFALNPVPGEEVYDGVLSADILPADGKFQYIKFGGGYATSNKNIFYDEIRAGETFDDVVGAPLANSSFMGQANMALRDDGEFEVTVQLSSLKSGTPVHLVMGTEPGVWSITNTFANPQALQPLSLVAQGYAPETTYYYNVVAVDSPEEPVFSGASPETFYTGAVSFDSAIATADEGTLAPARITVRRAATGISAPLLVHYTIINGTAVPGVDYVNEHQAGTITIPAGSATADIVITPLLNKALFADTTLTVQLKSGLYFQGDTTECAVTIVNAPLPDGYKVWTASTHGSFADGANWSPAGVPGPDDHILLGAYSTNNLTIPMASPVTVASWTQEEAYSGTVEIQTPFESTTPHLYITGDCQLESGIWTHPAGGTLEKFKLYARVDGDMTLFAAGRVDVYNKGFNQYKGAGGDATGGAYGGQGGGLAKPTYGSIFKPLRYGSSGGATSYSGGLLQLEVGGVLTLPVTSETATPVIRADGNNQCAGGSILLKVGALHGGNRISAKGVSFQNGNNAGGGGRIAIYLTHPGAQREDYHGTINVDGGSGFKETDLPSAGNGSIYWQTADQAAGAGTVISTATYTESHGLSYERRYLPIPAENSEEAPPDDLRKTTWIIRDNGRVKLTASFAIESLTIEIPAAPSKSVPTLNLNGKTLRMHELTIGSQHYICGTYTAADLGDNVIDTEDGIGRVAVGRPTVFLFR